MKANVIAWGIGLSAIAAISIVGGFLVHLQTRPILSAPWPVGTKVIGVMDSGATYVTEVDYVDLDRLTYIMDYGSRHWEWTWEGFQATLDKDIETARTVESGLSKLYVVSPNGAVQVLWEATQ